MIRDYGSGAYNRSDVGYDTGSEPDRVSRGRGPAPSGADRFIKRRNMCLDPSEKSCRMAKGRHFVPASLEHGAVLMECRDETDG